MNQQTASGQLKLRGRVDLVAEKSVELQGFKQEVADQVGHPPTGWAKLEHVSGNLNRQVRKGQSWPQQALSTQSDRCHP